ncbi:MAG: DUF4474 domain-containing protein [Clostridia bacterium]|nr:DUF4474 domain-containing protein [Clostridia bacterium]
MFTQVIHKFTALIAALLAVYYSLIPASLGAKNDMTFSDEDIAGLHSLADYAEYLETHGAPSMSTDVFLQAASPVTTIRRLLTGKLFAPESESKLDVTLSEDLTGMCDYIADNCGLDIAELLKHVPDLNAPAVLIGTVLQLDTAAFRAEVYRLRDQAYAEGDELKAALLYIFAAYMSVIQDVDIYTTPWAENPDELVVTLDVTFSDGETQTMYARIIIDPETGHAHYIDDKGILRLGFDVDVYDLVLYATVNCWQRKFGYSVLYDMFSEHSALFNYTTRRFTFNYGGKDWLIQIWKGNYAMITNGLELGIYNRPENKKNLFYSAAEDSEMMPMSTRLLHGDDVILDRPEEVTWWQNAFKFTKQLYIPTSLTLEFSLTFPTEEMLAAFVSAADNEPCGDVEYSVDGLTVSAVW